MFPPERIVCLTEETVEPTKTIPRAILLIALIINVYAERLRTARSGGAT